MQFLEHGDPAGSAADRRYRLIRFSIVRSLVATLALYTLHLVLAWVVPYRYNPGGLFLYHLVTHHLVFLVAVPVAAWWYQRHVAEEPLERMLHLLLFLATAYLLSGGLDAVRYSGGWTGVTALLHPLLRTLAVVMVVPALMARPGKVIWGLPFLVVPAALGSMWLEWFRPLAAVGMVALILVSGAAVLLWYILRSKGRDA